MLLTSPVFSVLKAEAPHLEIDALVYRDTADMLSGHPAVEEVHTIDRAWKKLGIWCELRMEAGLIGRLCDRCYDLVIHLTEHRRGAWLTRVLGPRYAVVPAGNFGGLFHRIFAHRYRVVGCNRWHTVEIRLDSLRRIGVYPATEARRLSFAGGPKAASQVERLIAERDLTRRPFVVVHPVSRWHFKCRPVPHIVELIDALQRKGFPVVLTCAPDEAELEIASAIRGRLEMLVVDLSGQLSLKEVGAMIRRARLFVGVDSAAMHMAAALGTPTVALFGPVGEIEWGPWQVPCRVLTSDHRCSPCGFDGCGGGKRSECLEVIAPSRAIAKAEELMRETA